MNADKISSENAIIIFETEPEKKYFLDSFDELKAKGAFDKYFGSNLQNFVIEEAP